MHVGVLLDGEEEGSGSKAEDHEKDGGTSFAHLETG
jgi:hypothetical protein